MTVETAAETKNPSEQRFPDRPGLVQFLKAVWHSWTTRSLAVGAVATVIDIAVLLVCVKALQWANPVGAMIGVFFGATFTFFANRHFAFRDHNPKLAPQAAKFALATAAGMLAHAQVVYVLADQVGVPVVLAKLASDVVVFTVGQMLLLRYFVFPRMKKPRPERVPAVIDVEPSL